ncbi:MAG: 30S ribosomal protein S21 [Phycisphaerae bacterium]|nr:30S ribosomal protein S21 [Phycisphaerae bacterium]
MAIRIKSRAGESVEQTLRRFKKLCEKEGLTKDVKRKQYYEKPSERRRRAVRKGGPRPLRPGMRTTGPGGAAGERSAGGGGSSSGGGSSAGGGGRSGGGRSGGGRPSGGGGRSGGGGGRGPARGGR